MLHVYGGWWKVVFDKGFVVKKVVDCFACLKICLPHAELLPRPQTLSAPMKLSPVLPQSSLCC